MIVATPGFSQRVVAFSSARSRMIKLMSSWLRRTVLVARSYSRIPCLVSVSQ